ncbi:polyprenyl synthetase family protein [Actinomadura sp. 6K520]|jgi:heptaprenyl diphosphate synthase|uniref:polyprenyl synthetase family protein n=1 Tax=Actinomadura sp. 6K520 TaxID=2530364 RepID=UPI001404D35E|nr:polyprenyl synthetase family protein [Actinomadura sp. 6K520]
MTEGDGHTGSRRGAGSARHESGWLTYGPARTLLDSLDGTLAEFARSDDVRLSEVAEHLLRRGGKRVRPALLFTAAGAASPAGSAPADDDLLTAAAAIELLHVAALYHDDVMDRAEMRRGVSTVNALRGDAEALTAGTFLFARAIRMLVELDGWLADWASQSALALALGQLQEAENTYNVGHRLDSYMQIAARKTAALFELSCRAGAHLAGASQETAEALGLYGRVLGLAFQAVDDTLDITADGDSGKRPGIDLREGVYGLPVLLVLQLKTAEADRLRRILQRDDLDEAGQAEARDLVIAAGGVTGAVKVAHGYGQEAVSRIAALAASDAKESLIRLPQYVVLRRH